MECGTYYAKDQKTILLKKNNGWKKEIKYIVKSYSSMMLSYVLFCYMKAEKELEDIEESINLYHDDEKIIDEMLKRAIEEHCIDLDLYYDKGGISVQ